MAKVSVPGKTVSCRMTLCYCALLVLTAFARPQKPCARFSFPTVSSNKILSTVQGSYLTLPFKLDTSQCSGNSHQPIYVYVTDTRRQDFCAVRFTPEGCKSISRTKCVCVDESSAQKGAVLTKTISSRDAGLWTWRTGNGEVREKLNFTLLAGGDAPPTVTDEQSSEKGPGREQEVTVEVAKGALVPATATKKDDKDDDDTHSKGEENNDKSRELVVGQSTNKAGKHVDILGKVIAIIIVIAIVVVCVVVVAVYRRRHTRRERRKSCVNVTPASADAYDDITVMRQRQEPKSDAGNSYVPLCPIRHSGDDNAEVFINDGYQGTFPRNPNNRESENLA